MLDVLNLSHLPSKQQGPAVTLDEVSLAVPAGHLLGMVGPTGSGKSTLLRLIAGLETPAAGEIRFQGHDTAVSPMHPNHVGFVEATDEGLIEVLTVRELLMSTHMLRVADQSHDQRQDRISKLLVGLGLEMAATLRVGSLPLSTRRRLKLALALVSDPLLVLCDEFTEGLDVKSAQELTALLRWVMEDLPGRIVIHASQSLSNLAAYDSVLILDEGHVCFHGPAKAVPHYFSITTLEELYPRLAKRPADRWGESWSRHRDQYYEVFKLGELVRPADEAPASEDSGSEEPAEPPARRHEVAPDPEFAKPAALPSLLSQAAHLTRRRWTQWRRTQREWLEHLALFMACPMIAMLLVAPNTGYLSEMWSSNEQPAVLWPAAFTCLMILFVQVLLILMVSLRLSVKEIARERVLFERERTAGVSSAAYLTSKLAFLIPLMIAHGAALVLLVVLMGGHLPGNDGLRLGLLVLSGVAFSCLCLGLSACSRSADRAHAHAWKLWAANVLLSGALLGFPRPLGAVLQPFLTAYYGWSGSVDTLTGVIVFEPMTRLVRTWFATPAGAATALLMHGVAGIALAAWGLKRRR